MFTANVDVALVAILPAIHRVIYVLNYVYLI